MAANPHLSQAAMPSGPEKLSAVTSLVEKLSLDLKSSSLLPQQRDEALEELKIYGRDPRNADPIFTKEGVEMLSRYAFDTPSNTTSRAALRCLCNTLLLNKECRQIFVDLGFEAKICNKLDSDSFDDEFLVSRIVFLTTYDTNINLEKLVDEYHLAESLVKNLERHARHHSDGGPRTDPMQDMALTESLKLLFNVTFHCRQRASAFTQAIPHIVTVLCKGSFQVEKPLDPPTGQLVNAMLNLELEAEEIQSSLYPQAKPTLLSDRLIDILEKSKSVYKDEELEAIVTPLIGAIRGLYDYAPQNVRTSIQQRLLPAEADRTEVLGRSTSLPSWLLQHSTNPITPKLHETICDLLFELSDKDASKLVENVGYGFASGLLYNKNIPMPPNTSEASGNDAASSSRPVNPITGQFLDSERQSDLPEMTEAEREREAERLFVLFQRLQANGMVSVENPLRTAVEEGRFEELPDDFEEDAD
ncbi:guanine nucleotide exchange factor [Xylaria palmicola]|nr:guanine nucleotide exchange factor [Xylaria palmicola]